MLRISYNNIIKRKLVEKIFRLCYMLPKGEKNV